MSAGQQLPTKPRRDWPMWAAVLALTLLVRGAVLVTIGQNLHADPDGYRHIAENQREFGVFGPPQPANPQWIEPSAFRPPIYPLLLAGLAHGGQVHWLSVGLFHLALGLGSVALVLLLARWWHLERWGLLAAVLVACDPILLNQSAVVMTETLATFMAVAALVVLTYLNRAATPARAGLAGGLIALAVLVRPTFLPWLAATWLVTACLPAGGYRRLLNLGTFALMAVLVLTPWTLRNYLHFGRPIATTTHGGYTLLLGNNPDFYRYLRHPGTETVWKSESLDFFLAEQQQLPVRGLQDAKNISPLVPYSPNRELENDALAYHLAQRYIRQEPGMFVYACVYRLGQLWSPLPHRTSPDESLAGRLMRYGTAVWYGAAYLLAGVGLYSLRGRILRTPWLWGLLLCLCFMVVHTFFWTNLRMRAPLMPVVYLWAAAGAGYLGKSPSGVSNARITL